MSLGQTEEEAAAWQRPGRDREMERLQRAESPWGGWKDVGMPVKHDWGFAWPTSLPLGSAGIIRRLLDV